MPKSSYRDIFHIPRHLPLLDVHLLVFVHSLHSEVWEEVLHPFASFIPPQLSQPLTITGPFMFLWICPFWTFHMKRTIEHVAFGDQLPSLKLSDSLSLHVRQSWQAMLLQGLGMRGHIPLNSS